MHNELRDKIIETVRELYPKADTSGIVVETSGTHADLASNAAFIAARVADKPTREVGKTIAAQLCKGPLPHVSRVEVAGPGFINFFLKNEYYTSLVAHIVSQGHGYGTNDELRNERIMVEYTDPNPFKQFHVGHIVPNAIGESLARLYEQAGADVKRVNYQGDVGLHVAKAIWGMQRMSDALPLESDPLAEKVAFLGRAYALGERAYQTDERAKKEIMRLNREIYLQTNHNTNRLYDMGRRWSLDYFETIYRRLGTKFDYYFFESETGALGVQIVEAGMARGVFVESEGVIIFPGEKYGLHNRVFINTAGLPTYEAKELGVAQLKYNLYRHTKSIIVAGAEVTEYFKVLLRVMEELMPDIARMTQHIPNGMLRWKTRKMSSRTGDVIPAETFINEVAALVRERMSDRVGNSRHEQRDTAEVIAVGAIKFAILRQVVGKDIVFDDNTAVSFEGDSGPYVQYTYARAQSILRKAHKMGLKGSVDTHAVPTGEIERVLARYPAVLARARHEQSPHHVCTYLLELAGAFNTFYGKTKIISAAKETPYYLSLTKAVGQVIRNGLYVLGITAPARM